MKNTQKILAMLLCLVMVVGMLAGCGTKGTEAEVPAAEDAASPAEAPAASEENPVITIGLSQNPNVEDYDTNALTLLIEERTGVDLQFVYFANDAEESASQLALMVSSGEKLPDILWGFEGIDKPTMYEYGEDGYFIDLNPYFEKGTKYFQESYDMMTEANQKNLFALGTDPNNGALYGFPVYSEGDSSFNCFSSYINHEWLEKIGEEMPTTTDELYNVLKKFATEDPNGNGKADEIPAIVNVNGYYSDAVQFIINAWVFCNDDYFFNATDGKVWAPYNTDEYRESLIYLNKLCSEGLLSPSSFTVDNEEMKAIWTPADGTALAGFVGGMEYLDAADQNEVLLQYSCMKSFAANTELGGYVSKPSDWFIYPIFITSSCENPDVAFAVLDYMSGIECFLSQRYGVEGTDWEYVNEGKSAQGLDAHLHILNDGVYANQNNHCWNQLESLALYDHYACAWTDDGSWESYRTFLNASEVINFRDTPVPAEVIHTLIYTADENEKIGEYATLLRDFVREQRALFVTGVLDPNDDGAWNSYLSTLESSGYFDYIAIAQSAYTRMFG